MSAANDEDEQGSSDAVVEAFEQLRGEVLALRGSMRRSSKTCASSAPDFSVDIARILKVLAGVIQALEALQRQAALQLTPEAQGAAIARAGSAATEAAALRFDRAIQDMGRERTHANIATTRLYDRRKVRPEDSPTFKVVY